MHLPRSLVVAASAPFYRIGFYHRLPVRWARRATNASAVALRVPAGTSVHHVILGGRPAERVTVGASERPRAILYLHGGAYSFGSPRLYRSLAASLALAAGAVVYSLDYRLAPEHVYPAALQDAVAAFRDLVTVQGFDPSRVAIAGDSAGGGLAVAAARVLSDTGMRPAALGLISPWTDPVDEQFTMRRDFVINRPGGRRSAAWYRGGADVRDPGYAPMHGRLEGLPPMLIHCSSSEMLHPQIMRFAALAEACGTDVRVVQRHDWWHSIHVLAGTLRAATDATHDLGAYLPEHLDGDLSDAPRDLDTRRNRVAPVGMAGLAAADGSAEMRLA